MPGLNRRFRIIILTIAAAVALCAGPFHAALAQEKSNLAPLTQWIGKDPFQQIGKKSLFEMPAFQEAFKKTAGQRISQKFMTEYQQGGRYFQSQEITEENGVMRVYVQNLAGESFYSNIFINIDGGYLDVCWNEFDGPDGKSPAVNAMLLHTGEKVGVRYPDCGDIDYKAVVSGEYSRKLSQEQAQFLGTWSGEFEVTIAQGHKAHLSRSITVTGKPSDPAGLRFTERDILKVKGRGAFTCSKSPVMDLSLEGSLITDGPSVTFIQEKSSNPACHKPITMHYALEGDTLIRKTKGPDQDVLKHHP